MRNTSKLATAIAAASIAGLVHAGQPEKADTYSDLDANQDGKISRGEAQSKPELESRWSELDVDRDNYLDEGEFARFEVEEDAPVEGGGSIFDQP